MPKPAVSVLVDTYNHERFIEEALVSVVEQDFPASDMEILVVDDGSTDRTPEIVRKFAPRVRLLRKSNGGQASAFNYGIPETQGEIVAFLDGDDWWARNKLTRVTEAIASDAEVGIVGHGIIIVHRDGNQQTEELREGFRFRANTVEGAKLLRRRSLLGTSRMTIRRELLQRIGSVPEAIRVQADEYLFTLAAALSGARILEEALTFYRLHDSNAFQTGTFDLERERRKQQSLGLLGASLLGEFEPARNRSASGFGGPSLHARQRGPASLDCRRRLAVGDRFYRMAALLRVASRGYDRTPHLQIAHARGSACGFARGVLPHSAAPVGQTPGIGAFERCLRPPRECRMCDTPQAVLGKRVPPT